MISFSKLGQKGRLANQCFQIVAMFGFAEKHNVELSLPEWKYKQYFPNLKWQTKPGNFKHVDEPTYHYAPDFFDSLDWDKDMDFEGYFQSEKWFPSNTKELFAFHPGLIEAVRKPFEKAFERPIIAVHVRRGDYVNNPNYAQLSPLYYLLALETHFPHWRDCNLIFFSDDPDYTKIHFQCLPNAYFSDNLTDIADLCLMSQCDHFIIANSSFSWWGAFLGEKPGTKIVRPAHHFAGKLASNSICDLYPKRWIKFDHDGKKIDLQDVTFTIPVSYDHSDRKENMELCLAFLLTNFNTNVIVGEQGGKHFEYLKDYCQYRYFDGMEVFHRTKMLNDMAKDAKTQFVANYDCDILLAPAQILEAAHRLRHGCDVASPFDGGFAGVPRQTWLYRLQQFLDVGIFGKTKFTGRGIDPNAPAAVGGAVFVNRESFFKAGGENEKFLSYGAEDAERWNRFHKLGLKVERVEGYLYHIEHFRGENSGNRHRYFQANEKEWQKVKAMSKSELEAYILTWNWIER